MAGKPAFDKSTAGKFWFGRPAFAAEAVTLAEYARKRN